LALAGAFSCSVFPDEATLLPAAGAASGAAGGGSVLPSGGLGGDGGDPTPLGGVGASEGGSLALGGAGAPPLGLGGVPDVLGGAPGGAGAPACASPQTLVGLATADSWIEAAKPNAVHGNDKALSVVSGGQERRALLQLALPAVPMGAVLLRARLALHLESNLGPGLAARELAVHLLEQEVIEARASWNNWGTAGKTWTNLGGDFGPALSGSSVAAGVSEANLTFNVTKTVAEALSAQAPGLPFIIVETSAPPPGPAELAFTSREGDASGAPLLIVDYCEP
jgi:hypothetical protein